jgi:putative ABC transport system substrate-binding protein
LRDHRRGRSERVDTGEKRRLPGLDRSAGGSIMNRRAVILAAGGGLLAMRFASRAQGPVRIWHIGLLSNGERPPDGAPPAALRQALAGLGYVDGKNVIFTGRWAEANSALLPRLAAELVDLHVDLLLTSGAPAAEAAKNATSTIPVVFVAPGDAADTGLITSLARPGGNITGISDPATELSAKRLALLKEAVPSATRVAVIWNATDRAMTLRYGEVERAARALRVTVEPLGVRKPDDIDAALSAMTRKRPDAVFVVSDALTNINRRRILEFAATNHIPAMYEFGYYVRDGGLMSYGPNFDDMWGRAAIYVDRILKGAKPGELPVEQPTRYYLVVNRTTARALDITLPDPLLLRADEVIP